MRRAMRIIFFTTAFAIELLTQYLGDTRRNVLAAIKRLIKRGEATQRPPCGCISGQSNTDVSFLAAAAKAGPEMP